jgi:hypothetical protein
MIIQLAISSRVQENLIFHKTEVPIRLMQEGYQYMITHYDAPLKTDPAL